ncbi:hypothetical protein, partial [Clostridium porci]|uniref:hypothetical protein n=1 Tax=Clostridium porci TaxID=2605778 RepID=UPI001A9AD542
FITIILSGLRLLWAIKAQFSTKPNWASKNMVVFSVYFSLTDAYNWGLYHACSAANRKGR